MIVLRSNTTGGTGIAPAQIEKDNVVSASDKTEQNMQKRFTQDDTIVSKTTAAVEIDELDRVWDPISSEDYRARLGGNPEGLPQEILDVVEDSESRKELLERIGLLSRSNN